MSGERSEPGVDLRVLVEDEAAAGQPIEVPPSVPPPAPESEAVIEAAAGSLAERMQARLERVRSQDTHEFALPGWNGDIRLLIGYLDRDEWDRLRTGGAESDLVVASTRAVLIRDEDQVLELQWGPEVAALLGMAPDTPPTRLLAALLGDREPWLAGLASDVLSWQMGRAPQLEELLGE